MVAFVANTNLIELIGLKDAIQDTFINDAAVTVSIRQLNGKPVAGSSWPLTVDYVTGSDGDYRVVLTHSLNLIDNKHYKAIIGVNAGSERIGRWEFPFKAEIRND